jgi:probable rRNA maturation factor
MPSKSKVYFFFNKKSPWIRNRNRLKKQVQLLFRREKKKLARLSYIFCSDAELLKINRQYLGHDFYTDIVTFDLSESRAEISGEVYISVDRVKDNAAKFGESLNTELARVVFHGALHLCGYGDKTAREKEKMRNKEDQCLFSLKNTSTRLKR